MRITQKHGVQANELQRKRRFTIRTKIMILSVSVAMIPLILSFFISASISMKNGRTDAYALVEDRTDNVASQVSAYVNQGYAVVQGLSYSSDICGLDPEMQSRILAQTVENNPALVLLYQQDLNGMQTARSSGELGSRADRWWFQQEIATRKPFVTKSYYSRTTQEAVTSIIFPVWGEKQQLIGILGADFGLTELQEIVDAYNTEEVHTIILDGEGSVIAHIDRTEVENIYNYVTATKTIREDDTEQTIPVDIPDELQKIANAVLSGESNTIEISSTEKSDMAGYIFSYAPVEIPGDSNNWAVITVEKSSAAYASTYQLILSILILTLVMVVAVVVIALFFTRTLTNPLRKLSDMAEKIADGDLNIALTAQNNDEIGDVSKAMGRPLSVCNPISITSMKLRRYSTKSRTAICVLNYNMITPENLPKSRMPCS